MALELVRTHEAAAVEQMSETALGGNKIALGRNKIALGGNKIALGGNMIALAEKTNVIALIDCRRISVGCARGL